jgi:S1-C subfamily serine protease
MDEQPTSPFPFPYGAPPPPPPPPPTAPQPQTGQLSRRRRAAVVFAAVAGLAVVAAAGGAGFALGRVDNGSVADGNSHGFSRALPPSGENPYQGMPFSGPGSLGQAPNQSGNGSPTDSQLSGLVRIATTLKYQGGAAAGTGMILTSDGEVITNNHVVEGATGISVKVMSTGQTYTASVVGTDSTDDVAVLQLNNANGLSTVSTDTSGVTPGDSVTAVGDAGGSTESFSAAKGQVTRTDQDITTQNQDGSTSEHLKGLFEVSSDVISGDSGGATYDSSGNVVGMTTAASTGSSDVVGYAIPIAKVLGIANDLENHVVNARYVYGSPAFLGIGLSGHGTTVALTYPGTPARSAGIQPGESITQVGGTAVRTAEQLKQAISSYSPGDQVAITWVDHAGTSQTSTVTLIAGPVA